MGPLSDERLARRAAAGERGAFDAIYRRYGQALYRFCLALVGDREDAEDALQSTMVKVLRALPGEQRTIELRPWLYRIARNESIEVLRRRRPGGGIEVEPETIADVAEQAEARERLRRLLADLGRLPERQRSVLVMRELSGLGFAEIAAALGTSSAVARQTLYEARLSLRQLERGREMRCAEVMRELSDGDGRVVRRREIRSHLRSCAECRAFREEIGQRRNELAGIAPLPLAASAGLLKTVLGAKAGAKAGAVASSSLVKSAATVAVATVVGVSAADRSGLVDMPLPTGDRGGAAREVTGPPPAAAPRDRFDRLPASVGVAVAKRRGPLTRLRLDGAEPRGSGHSPTAEVHSDTAQPDSPGSSTAYPHGGHGSDATTEGGPPKTLPDAAAHGQQKAVGRRPAHAGAPAAEAPKSRSEGASGRGREAGEGKGSAEKPAVPATQAESTARERPPRPPVQPPTPPGAPTAEPTSPGNWPPEQQSSAGGPGTDRP